MTAAGEKLQEIDRKAQTGEYLAVDVMLETLKVAAEFVGTLPLTDYKGQLDAQSFRGMAERSLLAEAEALKGEKERG